MPRTTIITCGLLVSLIAPSVTSGQANAGYTAQRGDAHFEAVNEYTLYIVVGDDTLGTPTTNHWLERHAWSADASGLVVAVTMNMVGAFGPQPVDTFRVTPAGRVVGVNGAPPAGRARIDLLPRLPDDGTPLEVGTEWHDTVSIASDEPYGPTHYSVERHYSVTRRVEDRGDDVLELVAEGVSHVREGGWQDSVAGHSWWVDVTGPVVDTALFDANTGSLIATSASMRLEGVGHVGGFEGADSAPAGLISTVVRRPVDPDRLALLLRKPPWREGDPPPAVLGIELGFTRDQVVQALGEPDGAQPLGDDAESLGYGLSSLVLTPAQGVSVIYTSDSTFVLDSIHVGSTRDQVQARWGPPSAPDNPSAQDDPVWIYGFGAWLLVVRFAENADMVEQMGIGYPATP